MRTVNRSQYQMPKITKFIATTEDGRTKEYKQYSRACTWLDQNQPELATTTFIIQEIGNQTAVVRHAK